MKKAYYLFVVFACFIGAGEKNNRYVFGGSSTVACES